MKRKIQQLVIGLLTIWQAPFVVAEDMDWQGSIALESNYVFSNAVEIDNNPVVQFWANGQFSNGIYVDFWTNTSTESGNPSQSGEIDWTVGYIHQLQSSKLKLFVAYYDIQSPDLFDNNEDVWGTKIHWSNSHYYAEVAHYIVDKSADGYLVGVGTYRGFSQGWSLTGKLNWADGPYQRGKIVVAKLRLSHRNPKRFFDVLSIELSEPLYQEDSDDVRGFAPTLSVKKMLFTD